MARDSADSQKFRVRGFRSLISCLCASLIVFGLTSTAYATPKYANAASAGLVRTLPLNIKTDDHVITALETKSPDNMIQLATINALGSSGTGDVTVSLGTSRLPSSGMFYADGELINYQIKNSTIATIIARGVSGTRGAAHGQ
jgi:hypothetical protein